MNSCQTSDSYDEKKNISVMKVNIDKWKNGPR